jgi:hypothetical protein
MRNNSIVFVYIDDTYIEYLSSHEYTYSKIARKKENFT